MSNSLYRKLSLYYRAELLRDTFAGLYTELAEVKGLLRGSISDRGSHKAADGKNYSFLIKITWCKREKYCRFSGNFRKKVH